MKLQRIPKNRLIFLLKEYCVRCIIEKRAQKESEGMTYLERKIDTYLMQWKQEKEHKPLIVKGPHFCTFLLKEYLRSFGR